MNEGPKDKRLAATAIIGAASLGMLTVCVPLCWIIGSPILAYLTVGSFGLSTLGVWAFGKPKVAKNREQAKEIADMQSEMDRLRGRLEDVEVLNRFEAGLAERATKQERGSADLETTPPPMRESE